MITKKTPYRLLMAAITFTSLLFFTLPLRASQPEGGWKRDIEVEGAPLTITWQNKENQPAFMIWMQDCGVPKPYPVSSEENKFTIPRKGVNSIPEKLLIVPNDDRLKPTVLDVPPNKKEITFNPDRIPNNEVWFWGVTPTTPCPPPSGASTMSIIVRLIHKRQIYANLHGAFLWHISLEKEDKYEIPFYFLPDMNNTLSSISIEDFSKANDISQSLCHAHHGGECVYTAETNGRVWGKVHEIKFEENNQFNRYDCPL